MNQPLYIGIDLGGTKIASVLATREGNVVATHHSWTNAVDGPAAVLDRVAEHVRLLRDQASSALAGIGIGSPGLVDAEAGVVRSALNLGWTEVDVRGGLRCRIAGLTDKIFIEKDANASAVGEAHFGAAAGCRDLALLTIGTGFGAGLLVNGQPVRGNRFAASDLGHLQLDPSGPPCICGHIGCAEMILSGGGIVRTAQRFAREASETTLRGDTIDAAQVLTAARAGDPVGTATVAKAGDWLGHTMAIVATMLDPDVIVVGGGLGVAMADLLLPLAIAGMDRRMAPVIPRPRVVTSTLESSALGAAAVAIAADA